MAIYLILTPGDQVAEFLKWLFPFWAGGIDDVSKSIDNFVNNVWSRVVTSIIIGINGIVLAVNALISAIQSVIEWFSRIPSNIGGIFAPRETVKLNPETGKRLAGGGTLFEDVVGVGTSTGTPHMLHAGEQVIPASRSGRGGSNYLTIYVHGSILAEKTVWTIAKNGMKDMLKQHGWD